MSKAFVIGSMNMDFIFRLDCMPKKGQTISSQSFQSSPGGKGSNQAVALAKQGMDTYMIGSLGDDHLATTIQSSLSSFGVHCDFIQRINHQDTGLACIMLEDDDNYIVTNAGANAVYDMSRVEQILKKYANQDDVLLIQLEIPVDVVEKSLNVAKDIGMATVLNAAPIKNINDHTFQLIDILVVNESEAETLSNKSLKDEGIESVCQALLSKGVQAVLLTLGPQGSYYVDKQETISTPAYPVKVVDTTGAGDSFIGCFIANKFQGKDIINALKKASACAALTIQGVGVHHAIPWKKDVEEFMKERQ